MEFTCKASVFYFALFSSILIRIECNIKTSKTVNAVKGSNWEAPRATLTTNAKWIQTALDKHNYYRDRHRAPRLSLNNTLSEISQAWCNHLLRKGVQSFNRSKSIDFFDHNNDVLKKASLGENLYYAVNYASINASLPVRLWYEEIKDYDFVTGKRKSTSHPKAKIGHLTQLIWKSTTQMGTSYATEKLYNGQTLTFVCANYFPGGNIYAGQGFKEQYYLKNVLPAIKGDKENGDNDYNTEENQIIIPIRWPGLIKANVTTENVWIQQALDIHNKLRALHGVEELKFNQELCEISQSWSNFLLKSGITTFNNQKRIETYRKNDQTTQFGIGENTMYFLTDGPVSAETVVNLWYQEKQYYDFTSGKKRFNVSRSASTEHFTQVVWKSTSEFGMTYSSSKLENGQTLTFIVANYFPSKYAAGISWERNCLDNVPKPNSAMRILNLKSINFCGLFLFYLLRGYF